MGEEPANAQYDPDASEEALPSGEGRTASWRSPVSRLVKSVGEPDARNGHVRFDERGWKRNAFGATAPILDSYQDCQLIQCR
jgi:hypothetical protein